MTDPAERGEVLWRPPDDAWATTAIGRLGSAHGCADYDELLAWSLADLDGFWAAVTDFTGMRWFEPPTAVREGSDMPGVRWFPGGTLNYAGQALAPLADGRVAPDDIAVVAHSQTREPITLSWRELASAVERCAAGLAALGVGPGERVVAYAPNIPETLVAFLAAARLGAVWSSCAPEFGVRSVIDRFGQIEPVVLIAVDGYRYGTKAIDRRGPVAEIVAALPTLRDVVTIDYLGNDDGSLTAVNQEPQSWNQLLASGTPVPDPVPVPADHPLYVLFSSGTTGLPKAIVHGHGGIVAEHLKILALHHDLGPGDRFFWYSTTGWMMWNYLVSGLLTGSTVVLFDGDPAVPSLDMLWQLADEVGVTVFGTSASFLMACRKAGLHPTRGALRSVGSTGSPLPADGFRWVVDTLGVPVASVCGGTDVCTAFLGSSPVHEVRAGEIGGRLLGCAIEAFTPEGQPCPPGVTGELVITAPLPSMPVAFWGDDDGSKMRAAYFEDFPGVWRHGDWVTFHDDGSCVITGRSDATLNRGGVRLGTSDFYAVVEAFDEIADSLVVHLDDESGEGGLGELILFVSLTPGVELADDLVTRVRRALAAELSPRHVPDAIEVVAVVPRTLSGKKLELPVKRILRGARPDDVASRDSLADPTALDAFVRR